SHCSDDGHVALDEIGRGPRRRPPRAAGGAPPERRRGGPPAELQLAPHGLLFRAGRRLRDAARRLRRVRRHVGPLAPRGAAQAGRRLHHPRRGRRAGEVLRLRRLRVHGRREDGGVGARGDQARGPRRRQDQGRVLQGRERRGRRVQARRRDDQGHGRGHRRHALGGARETPAAPEVDAAAARIPLSPHTP
ncbi:expressed protein, partial [Aureococcus anophagefferens]